jgi:hypothetical protein
MNAKQTYNLARLLMTQSGVAVTFVLSGLTPTHVVLADDAAFHPGNLVVSRVIYDNNPTNVTIGMTLPPNCVASVTNGIACDTATADGTYPTAWNNALVDGSFGITAKIILDQLTPSGILINSLEVPNSSQNGVPSTKDQMVTSFSSKSELALNLSTDNQFVTFMGYLAPIDALDVSNSNTPGVVDPTNPVPGQYFRVVAQVDSKGKFRFAKTNAYSGNNGRAAVLNANANVLYTAGNAGNGALTPSEPSQPNGVIAGTGAQILTPETKALVAQNPGFPTPVGSFNITQLPANTTPDKIGKDTNFRGLTIFNNVVYYTKGSGSNGINTVYFIDNSGYNSNGQPLACPQGVGLPSPLATLPTTPIFYNGSLLPTEGVVPYNMCVLAGFPTVLAKKATLFPFGVWFANSNTLYVADEGNGDDTFSNGMYTNAAAQKTAGLQKWVFSAGSWNLAYTLQKGLGLGQPYTVSNYPTGNNAATSLPWSPATDGLRNLTGRVNGDGTVTIWAITSTVSGNGDQGADPNQLVAITDTLALTTLPTAESFTTVRSAGFGEVLRGVSFTPGTQVVPH